MSVQGRLETVAPRETGHSSGEVALQCPERQLSLALLTLMAAMAAELKVGLMARTVSQPAGCDWLLTLHGRPSQAQSEGAVALVCRRHSSRLGS